MATLINLINGKSAKCKINVPEYSACYASHDNLMRWARKTGCARALHRLWHGESADPFIAIVGVTVCGFAVYRNEPENFSHNGKWCHYHKGYVEDGDPLAFFAEEVA